MSEEFDFVKHKLSPKERKFCELHTNGATLVDAMNNAGFYSDDAKIPTIQRKAHRILAKENIKAYIKFLQNQAASRAILTKRQTLERLSKIAKFNIGNVVSWNDSHVTATDSQEISEAQKYGIAKIRNTRYGLEIITCDKVKALSQILSHYEKMEGLNDHGRTNFSEKDKQSLLDRVSQFVRGTPGQ